LFAKIEYVKVLAVAKVGEDTATSYQNLMRWTTFLIVSLSMNDCFNFIPINFYYFFDIVCCHFKTYFRLNSVMFLYLILMVLEGLSNAFAAEATSTNIDITNSPIQFAIRKIEKEPFTSQN
jgi:hypothetical protein